MVEVVGIDADGEVAVDAGRTLFAGEGVGRSRY